jgi:hypothetical protein
MSDLSSTSYCNEKRNDNNTNMLLPILLLCLCGGNGGLLGGSSGLFGGGSGNDGCSLCNGGMDGILPILLILMLSGGSIF